MLQNQNNSNDCVISIGNANSSSITTQSPNRQEKDSLLGRKDESQQEFENKLILRLMRLLACCSGGAGVAVGAYAQGKIIEDAKKLFGVTITPSPGLTLGLGVMPTIALGAFNDSSFKYWEAELYNAFKDKTAATCLRKVEFISFTIFSIILSVPQYFFTSNGINNSKNEEIYKLFKILQIPIAVTNGYGSVFSDFYGIYKTYRHFVHGDLQDGSGAKFNVCSVLPLALCFIIAVFIFLLLGEMSLPSGKSSVNDNSITCPREATNFYNTFYNGYTLASFIPEVLTMTIILYEIYHKVSINNIIDFLKSPTKMCGLAFTIICAILQGYTLKKAVEVVAECALPGIGATGVKIAEYAAIIIGAQAFTMLWTGSMSEWVKIGSNTFWETVRKYAETNSGGGAQAGDASTLV